MPRHRKGPPTDVLAAEYAAGATSTDLAAKYGMHHVAIIGRLRRAGHPIREARRRSLGDDAERTRAIAEAYQRGDETMLDIARRLGTSPSTVQRALQSAGVKTRPHGLRRRSVRVPTDAAKLGYFAGLLDGEGNVQFRSKRDGSASCRMHIYSTTPGIMRWLLREIGGTVRYDTKRTEQKGWLPIGIWSVYRARDVTALLRAAFDLLIVKRAVARRVFDMAATHFGVHDSPPTMIQSSLGEP
jgi:Helix-turn-helix domain